MTTPDLRELRALRDETESTAAASRSHARSVLADMRKMLAEAREILARADAKSRQP